MDLRRKVIYKPRKKRTSTSLKDREFRKDRDYKEFRNSNLMLMFLLKKQTQEEVIRIFDYLTEVLGIELFKKLFEVILTDNGHEFQNRLRLECDEKGEIRTQFYYCDPNRSD